MTRKKNTKSKSPGKHGFRSLSRNDDLGSLFGRDPSLPDEDRGGFASLLAALPDEEIQKAAREKVGHSRTKRYPLAAVKSYPPPQRELDLHGKTANQASVALKSFIETARQLRLKSVRVITGKGLHSEETPVLPRIVEDELTVLKAEGKILLFSWEKKIREISGSVVVYFP